MNEKLDTKEQLKRKLKVHFLINFLLFQKIDLKTTIAKSIRNEHELLMAIVRSVFFGKINFI